MIDKTDKAAAASAGDGRSEEYDKRIMDKVRAILARGNHAEIKRKADGSVSVFEVKKKIV